MIFWKFENKRWERRKFLIFSSFFVFSQWWQYPKKFHRIFPKLKTQYDSPKIPIIKSDDWPKKSKSQKNKKRKNLLLILVWNDAKINGFLFIHYMMCCSRRCCCLLPCTTWNLTEREEKKYVIMKQFKCMEWDCENLFEFIIHSGKLWFFFSCTSSFGGKRWTEMNLIFWRVFPSHFYYRHYTPFF